MNPAHVHLLLNHFPTIGFAIGLVLFVMALLLGKTGLRRVCLVIFFLSAAVTIATYVSGNDARELLKENPDVSDPLMQVHESAALLAFVFMQVTGFLSWIGLWVGERSPRFARWNVGLVLVFAVFTFVLMSRAAYMGGAIRHPETLAAETIPVDPSVPTLPRAWGLFVQDHSWVWPACETLHFVGLSLLFGVVLLVNLRLLGVGKSMLSAAALSQLLPLGMLGFAMNLVTGMMFFVATPEQYTGAFFFLKMALVVAGALNLLFFMLGKSLEGVGDGGNAGIWAKLLAVSAILIWTAVIFCGHMLPWLGNSF
jgi:uncharacterized membrane protein